jgi:hypothetical protein
MCWQQLLLPLSVHCCSLEVVVIVAAAVVAVTAISVAINVYVRVYEHTTPC